MADDYGLAVSPTFRESPLMDVSASALRVWLVLAAQAPHVARTFDIGKHTLVAERGEVLIALRTLRDVVGGGLTRLRAALQELADVGAIEIEPVTRPATYPSRARQRAPTEHVQRAPQGYATNCLLSRIKVNGFKGLPANWVRARSGYINKGRPATPSPYSTRDRHDIRRANAQLEAEGR